MLKPRAVTRRRIFSAVAAAGVLAVLAWFAWSWLVYPSDRSPDGAYLRVMSAVNRGKPEAFFAYLETPAQHACFTIRTYRRQARDRVQSAYPEPERTRLLEAYGPEADAPDGADVFAVYAQRRGWLDRLRRDMSGVSKVEINGERATVETARGTRYPFRRRENGIWGLTLFSATLVAEAEKAARDAAMIEQAARDYERVKKTESGAIVDGGERAP
jgi:hypothetical protein